MVYKLIEYCTTEAESATMNHDVKGLIAREIFS